ncbi:MAG: protein kinase, partial [Acidobacteriota bacterium]
MAIEAGQQLLHYRLIEKIGEGGMGVVWEAVDTTLDREVAIKILPDAFSKDADRVARFEREAKLLASLNNPQIAAIYGLHEVDGYRFLAMELIVGEDLSQRLERGPLGLDEALDVAEQIALGVEAAHDNGVIHRDLKPANVRLTPEGKVKVLDFGLAKAFSPEPMSEAATGTLSPTVTSAGTIAGMILGTARYMSPEQARGKPVDRRTDVWAFGCVLYEMLTGRAAFQGETITDILAALVHVEPDFAKLPPSTPAGIRRLLRRCLRKDVSERLRDIGDARLEIVEARSEDSVASAKNDPPTRAISYRTAVLLALAGVLLGLAIAFFAYRIPPGSVSTDQSVWLGRVPLALDADYPLSLQRTYRPLEFSPDGRSLVYVARVDEIHHLVRVDLDDFEPQLLSGTEGAKFPFFSPDGEWIAFFADGELHKILSRGGRRITLTDVPGLSDGCWAEDGWIYFSRGLEGISRVRDRGGAVEQIVESEEDANRFYSSPQILPAAQVLIYTGWVDDSWNVYGMTLGGLESKLLVEGATLPRYAAGHLIYARSGNLLAAPFDPVQMLLTGQERSVFEPYMDSVGIPSEWTVTPTGTLAYVPVGLFTDVRSLVWVDRRGNEAPVPAPHRRYNMPRISPDGGRIVVDIVESGDDGDIWIFDLRREQLTQVTIDPAHDSHPLWLPNGREIVFNSDRDGSLNIYRKSADGSGEVVRLTEDEASQWPLAITRDGDWIVYDEWNEGRMVDIIRVRTAGGGAPR